MIYLELVNTDEVFHSLRRPPVIANGMDITTEAGKEKLDRLIMDRYEGDSLNILPSCECGELHEGQDEGEICPECGTVCEPIMERKQESLIWFRAPEGVRALINPSAWIILSEALTISGFNILLWFCDSTYKPEGKIPAKFQRLDQHNFSRGLNFFHDNFDAIMKALFALKLYNDEDIVPWVADNRQKIFCQYLPMPSKVGFVVESGGPGAPYIDKTITLAVDALRTIIGVDNSPFPLQTSRKQTRVVKGIVKLAEYYATFVNKTLGGKPGIFRKHTFGARLSFTGRGVISSLSGPHAYDELHLPWSLSIQLLEVHLTGKLLKGSPTREPMSPIAIEKLLRESTLQYSPIIDELFEELIAESPYKGLPCLFQRNPSLARGSAQLLYATRVKKNPRITTISFSTLCLKAPNADYDGDEMNLLLVLDEVMQIRLSRMEPHLGALDLGEPRRISGNLSIPSPVAAAIASWLDHPDQFDSVGGVNVNSR